MLQNEAAPRKTAKKSASPRTRTSSPRAKPPRVDPVTQYAQAVIDGGVIAGPYVRGACRRHLNDLKTAASRGIRFNVELVDRACGFFRDVLCLNGGEHEGRPFALQLWQKFVVGSLFGWERRDPVHGWVRRFRTAYIEIGKGNGKSPLAAGIGMYCLMADGEARAEVYAAATKKDQAMILFRDAVAMVDWSPELNSRVIKSGTRENCWNVAYPETGSFFRAISSDDGQSGPRPHCALIDEIHEHQSPTVINMMSDGQKGRRQPLTVEITNSGFDRTSICFQHHEYSTRVVSGMEENDEWFAYVCALDEKEDPLKDEACWMKANPNLGVSIHLSYLRKQVREAIGMPAKASTVRRLNFCMWVDAENPWIDGPLWLESEKKFDALELLAECDDVCGALDLSGTNDLTALALTGRRQGRVIARVEFWTPADTLEERSKRDKVPYNAWAELGFVTATPGRAVDYDFVAQRIIDLQAIIPLTRIAFDPYRIKYLEKELDRLNVEVELIEHPQGVYKAKARKDPRTGEEIAGLWMPRSVELLEKAIFEKIIDVEKNPCLTWNSASAVLEPDAKDNRYFTKRKSRGRIDGIVALSMSMGLLNADSATEREYQLFVL